MITGVFLAIVACAIFGVMIRFVPLSRLRTVALWLQFVVGIAPLVVNGLQRPVAAAAGAVAPRLQGIDWSFLPFTWFAAIGVAGHAGRAAGAVLVAGAVGGCRLGRLHRARRAGVVVGLHDPRRRRSRKAPAASRARPGGRSSARSSAGCPDHRPDEAATSSSPG